MLQQSLFPDVISGQNRLSFIRTEITTLSCAYFDMKQ
jgi:hypothetical protein